MDKGAGEGDKELTRAWHHTAQHSTAHTGTSHRPQRTWAHSGTAHAGLVLMVLIAWAVMFLTHASQIMPRASHVQLSWPHDTPTASLHAFQARQGKATTVLGTHYQKYTFRLSDRSVHTTIYCALGHAHPSRSEYWTTYIRGQPDWPSRRSPRFALQGRCPTLSVCTGTTYLPNLCIHSTVQQYSTKYK